jgi:hypothetical protein
MGERLEGLRIVRYSPGKRPRTPYDPDKFYELVKYLAWQFKDDVNFGRIKLAKLIFNIDRESMREFDRPLTGVTYRKDEWGHNPVQLLHAELDLLYTDEADIIIGDGEEEPRFIAHDERRRLVPRKEGNPELSPDEQRIVDAVIAEYRATPAKALSDESHKTVSWEITDWKKEIPIEMLLVGRPTERDEQAAEEVARKLGLATD